MRGNLMYKSNLKGSRARRCLMPLKCAPALVLHRVERRIVACVLCQRIAFPSLTHAVLEVCL